MRRNNVLFDTQIFEFQTRGGISKYYTELIRELGHFKSIKIIDPLLYVENIHRTNMFWRVLNILFRMTGMSKKIKNYLYYLQRKRVIKLLKEKKIDLFFPTYYDNYFLEFIDNTPFIITVHDMIPELFFSNSLKYKKVIKDKQKLIFAAQKIIAISNSTYNDLLKIYPNIDKDKIEIVYHGISQTNFSFINSEKKLNKEGDRYILFVGKRSYYKNFKWLLNSIANWLLKNNIKLLCIGGGYFSQEEKEIINYCNLTMYVFQLNCSDKELEFYYCNSMSLVYPSRYEGFGFPILEAMSYGCTVVLPFTSSFPEVAGNAGFYYDLNDNVSFLNTLNKAVFDEKLREIAINEGFKQVQKFKWSYCAQKTKSVFDMIL